MIKDARAEYDEILFDIDNGSEAMVRKGNNLLYSLSGLTATYAALRRGADALMRSLYAIGPPGHFRHLIAPHNHLITSSPHHLITN